MRYLRISFRLALIAFHIAAGLIVTATMLRHGETRPLIPKQCAVIMWWHQRITRILALRVRLLGMLPKHLVLLVCNQISWLDIPVLGSLLPVSILSKIEIRRWSLPGRLAAHSGTLFIERGGKRGQSCSRANHLSPALRRQHRGIPAKHG